MYQADFLNRVDLNIPFNILASGTLLKKIHQDNFTNIQTQQLQCHKLGVSVTLEVRVGGERLTLSVDLSQEIYRSTPANVLSLSDNMVFILRYSQYAGHQHPALICLPYSRMFLIQIFLIYRGDDSLFMVEIPR